MFRSALSQMIATLTATVSIVLVITFVVVLFVPTPEAKPVSLRQAAAALTAAETAASSGLGYSIEQDAPEVDDSSSLQRQRFFETILSNILNRPTEDIIVIGSQSETFTQVTVSDNPFPGLNPNPQPGDQQPEFEVGSPVEVSPPIIVKGSDAESVHALIDQLLQDGQAENSSISIENGFHPLMSLLSDIEISTLHKAALRNENGDWSIVTRKDPILTGWRLQLLVAFLLSAVALIPIGWFAARQLSQPLRDLEQLANVSEVDQALDASRLSGSNELLAAALALQKMHNRLSMEVGKRSRLVAALAHDLRTPLTSLRVRIETAVSNAQREKMAVDISRMEAMIHEMMAYAQGADAKSPDTDLNLNEIVSSVVDEMALKTPIHFNVLERPLVVRGHRLALQRALTNLIDNAQNYGSDVEVHLSAADHEATISVSNKAVPFSEDDLTRLLTPFERGEQSRNRDTGGTGLGLAIASDIAKHHNGTLVLENRTPNRVAAVLTLPLA